jgi:hypothetical protein
VDGGMSKRVWAGRIAINTAIVSAMLLICFFLGEWLNGRFAFGLLGGALATMYIRRCVDYFRTMDEYDEMMTNMMNSVPQSQRFGYTEDFKPGTRWEL